MPSPFPGMDPFLEHPNRFPDLHLSLVFCIKAALQPLLPEPYFAATGERVWVEFSQRYVDPDVDVLHTNGTAKGHASSPGGTAVACKTRSTPILIQTAHDPFKEAFVEVYSQREDELRLVTSIEVLSLSNKTPGATSRELYRKKHRELRAKKVHMIEIDLLRAGRHSTAVPFRALKQASPRDYHVCLRPFNEFGYFYVWPIRLEDKLPEIIVPLLPGDKPVPLDLQRVFEQSYEAGNYRRRANYAKNTPVPPLRPDQAEWATRLLREQGLLPSSPPS